MAALTQDLRYAIRLLVRYPGFSLVAVLALALGIGSMTSTFSVANAYLLRPLPFSEPERLVHVWETNRRQGWSMLRVSLPNFLDYREQGRSFEDLAVFNYTGEDLTAGDRPEQVQSGRVSANIFTLLGVEPMLGRGFRPGEDAPGQGDVVVLGHRFWQTRFAGDRDVLGRTLEINGRAHTIIGVMPPEFVFPLPTTQIWVPRVLDTAVLTRDRDALQVVGRLRAGVTRAEAQGELDAIARRIADAHPVEAADRGVNIVPLRSALNFAYDIIQMVSIVLLVANLFVLLIACANISSLLLSRAINRTREVAVRAALGASRGRLLRQFLIESAVLAAIGGLAGLGLAAWSAGFFGSLVPDDIYRIGDVSIDGMVLLFSAGVSLLTVLMFGLVPALRSSDFQIGQCIKDGGRAVAAGGGRRLQSVLVGAEIAMSIMLLAGTALMIRTYQNLQRVDPGFEASGVLTMTLTLPSRTYGEAARTGQFHEDLRREAAAMPGVMAAATVDYLPLNHETDILEFTIPGRDPGTDRKPTAISHVVSPGYFELMAIPMRRGRVFTDGDRSGSVRVAIVNETLAQRFWPGADPVGQSIDLLDGEPFTIVGVAGDTRHMEMSGGAREQAYLSQWQFPGRYLRLLVRTAADPLAATAAVSEAVWRVDPTLPIVEVRSLAQVVSDFLLPQQAMSGTLFGLALGAMLLAVVGVYGLMAFYVSQRTQEIGLRMALGAARGDVVGLVLGRGLRLALGGLVFGLAGAVALGRIMASLLHGVGALDPVAFVGAPALLVAVAMLACYLPARRAAKVDPLVALRYQ